MIIEYGSVPETHCRFFGTALDRVKTKIWEKVGSMLSDLVVD
jgi:hypothetical protein